jgi:pimeloyl-ACP methyl ester carboxylesterase
MKKFSLFFLTILISFACTTKTKEINSRKEIKRNNITIDYSECGKGDTTLLFLHGWCINKEYWEAQVDHFCGRFKVVTIDLPGFGKSGKTRDNWTFDEYREDVKTVIDSLHLKNVILIGHSMSGDIVLKVDSWYPKYLIGIVGVDNLKDTGSHFTAEQLDEINNFFALLSTNYKSTVEGYARAKLFHASTDTSVITRVVNDIRNADSVIATKVLRASLEAYQQENELMQRLNHKLYLINSDFPPTNVAGLKKFCKHSVEVLTLNGTGHYPMIEKPGAFNDALEQVIKRIHQ